MRQPGLLLCSLIESTRRVQPVYVPPGRGRRYAADRREQTRSVTALTFLEGCGTILCREKRNTSQNMERKEQDAAMARAGR